MTKTLFKETLRSVVANKLRFISVIVIIALGVSFFVGVKSALPEMRYKANEYFSENNLLDIRVTSPIPFSEGSINRIKELDGVESVIASKFADGIVYSGDNVLVDTAGASLTCRVMEYDMNAAKSFTQDGTADNTYVNRISLVEGRYPVKDNECVIDSNAVNKYDNMKIGSTITVKGDAESITEKLKVTEFLIVGTVDSPMYISPDRGNTAIGSGMLSTYICVGQNAFNDTDINELFIKIDNSESYDKFSQSYKDTVTKLSDEIQGMSTGILDAELAVFKNEYSLRITTKENEIIAYQTSSELSLASKKAEIDKLKSDVDNEDQILNEAKAKSENAVKSTKSTFDSLNSQYSKAEAAYNADVKSFDSQSAGIKGYTDLKLLYDELNNKHKTDEKSLAQLKESMDKSKANVDVKKSEANKYNESIADYNSQINKIQSTISSLQSEVSALKTNQSSLESQISSLNAEIARLDNSIAALEEKLNNGTLQSVEVLILSNYRSTRTNRKNELKSVQSELDGVKSDITSKNNSIASQQSSLVKANENLEKEKTNYSNANADVTRLQSVYNSAVSSYNSVKSSYDADTATLKKYKSSMDELTSGQKSLVILQNKVENEKNELDTLALRVTQAKIAYTLAQKDGESDIQQEQSKLNAAKARYGTVDTEYQDLQKETEETMTNLNGDLKNLRKALKSADSMEWSTTPLTSLSGYDSYNTTLSNVRSLAKLFPAVFFITAMLACLVILFRNVEEEKVKIGLLRGIGYSSASILFKYLLYSLMAWIVGAALGVLIGSCALPQAVYSIYSSIYTIPKVVVVFNFYYIYFGLAVSLAGVITATVVACIKELVFMPAIMMIPKSIHYMHRSIIEKIPFLWRRFSYGMVLVVRTISRSKRRVFISAVGVACCTGLILSAFGLVSSATSVTNLQYGNKGIFKYDTQFVLDTDQNVNDSDILNKISNDSRTSSAMLTCMETANVASTNSSDAAQRSAQIIVPQTVDQLPDFIDIRIVSGAEDFSGVIISEKLAKDIGAEAGRPVYFTLADSIKYEVMVTGIAENYINNYMYFSPDCYEEVFEVAPEYKYVVSDVKEYMSEADTKGYVSDFLKNDEILGAVTLSEMANSVDISIGRIIAFVTLFIICACILAAIVIYTTVNISIGERMREIANIKVVGFSDGEVMRYVSRENVVSTILGAVIGLIGGTVFSSLLVGFIAADTVMYESRMSWWCYLATLIVVAIVAALSLLPAEFRIKRIDMAETLKSTD